MFTVLHRRSSRIVCCTLVTVTLASGLPLAASASPPNSRHAPETNSMTVSLSGLDLTTPQGLREARERLAKAAQHLCRRWSDSRKVDDSASYALCTEETIAKALSQLPTAVLNARN
jgi:UrcA family protein